jgi:predicted nucleotide-binding protein
MKPKLFIGSSTEGKPIADAIHAVLYKEVECTVWTEGVFQLSEYQLQSLMRQVRASQFGVFVFSSDDVADVPEGYFASRATM